MFRLAALLLSLAAAGQAYYHFVHYQSRFGPWTAIPEKFDLNALLNKTVYYVVSETGPAQLAPGDTMNALVSQIRLAASSWNAVETSELKLAFGGFAQPGAFQASPVMEILFDEVPPGLVAIGGVTARGDLASSAPGGFVPILRSTVVLRRDLSARPSWSEPFFLTLVHEIGHALGLQHTFTSGVMSTESTRAVTKARPISADDAAGLSVLYPTPAFAATTGTIRGRVVSGADPVNLASVVAISPDGHAVSALTAPDGSYEIRGLPPGSYYVYTHPLPPQLQGESYPGNVLPPSDLEWRAIPMTGFFDTVFYPGTRDHAAATVIPVGAGNGADNIDFNVRRRATVPLHTVVTYSFPGQVAVKPAHLNPNSARNIFVATGVGLISNGAIAPNLRVGVVGGSAVPISVRPYSQAPQSYIQVDFQFGGFPGEGARHLVFHTTDDVYVLPGGFRMMRQAPPSIDSVTPEAAADGSRLLRISGSALGAGTRVLFDGVPGTVRPAEEPGVLRVAPPPGTPGEVSAITVFNPDGQSSLFLQPAPSLYEFEPGPPPAFSISPSQLAAGTDAMVEVTGVNTNFSQANVAIAFGSADVVVRRLWVTAPNRILAHVAIAQNAAVLPTTVTLVSGMRTLGLAGGFQVAPAGRASVRGLVTDATSGKADVAPGAVAAARLTGPSSDSALSLSSAVQVTINDRPAQVVGFTAGLLNFNVPSGTPPGPATLRISVNGETLPPVVISVDLPPPFVTAIHSGATRIDFNRPARPGEVLTLSVSGLTEADYEVPASKFRITVGGVVHSVLQTAAVNGGSHTVQIQLSPSLEAGNHPLTIAFDGRVSPTITLPVR
jgi:uncharacterized protein (TIGR03437 family)